jgi:hypothetical protein
MKSAMLDYMALLGLWMVWLTVPARYQEGNGVTD